MPIIYSVISRGSTVLAKFAECVGNFAEVTEQIISHQIPLNESHKLTYAHGPYRIHYICENRIVYMCITDADFDKARAFLFLSDIKQEFNATYGLQVATAISYGMNTEFSRILKQKMQHYTYSKEVDKITRMEGQIGELKDIMVKNIDSLRDRGEKLELLVNKTENLSNNSVTFRKTSRNLARQMFWKNIRLYVVIGLIIVLVIYLIISMSCGGLLWPTCIHKT